MDLLALNSKPNGHLNKQLTYKSAKFHNQHLKMPFSGRLNPFKFKEKSYTNQSLKHVQIHFWFTFKLPKPIDYSIESLTQQFDDLGFSIGYKHFHKLPENW